VCHWWAGCVSWCNRGDYNGTGIPQSGGCGVTRGSPLWMRKTFDEAIVSWFLTLTDWLPVTSRSQNQSLHKSMCNLIIYPPPPKTQQNHFSGLRNSGYKCLKLFQYSFNHLTKHLISFNVWVVIHASDWNGSIRIFHIIRGEKGRAACGYHVFGAITTHPIPILWDKSPVMSLQCPQLVQCTESELLSQLLSTSVECRTTQI